MKIHFLFFSLLLLGFVMPVVAQHKQDIYHEGWIDLNKNGEKDVYENPAAPIDKRVKDLLNQMNLQEKASQLVTVYGYGAVLEDPLPTEEWKNEVWGHGIANIDEHLTGLRNSMEYALPYDKHIKDRNTTQQFFIEDTRLGIPVDFTDEGLAGLQHAHATSFPREIAQGSTFDRKLIKSIGEIEGREAKALGYTNIYSPEIDVSSDPRWGRVTSCYSSSPFLTRVLGSAMVNGIQSQGVASTLKHFAVYSIPIGGRDGDVRTHPRVAEREMRELYLAPFRHVIEKANPMGVMASYNEYDGVPIIASKRFLTDILRDKYGFDGYVVSDSRAVEYVWEKHHVAKNAEDGIAMELKAGLNVRTDFTPPSDFVEPLLRAVKKGKIPMEVIDKRVGEVLKVKFRLGLFDQPYMVDLEAAKKIVHNQEAKDLSLKAAHESIVLLKNENKILPLDVHQLNTLAVIGPNAKEVKSLSTRYGPVGNKMKSIFEGIKKALPAEVNLLYAKGIDHVDPNFPKSDIENFPLDEKEKKSIAEAVEIAQKADVVILSVGDNNKTVGEMYSRLNIDLPGHQKELVKAVVATGKPVVMVLTNGRPVSINWADKNVDGIIESWYLGETTGTAVSDVLFGNYNPGGKLAIPFPKSAGQSILTFPLKPGDKGWGFAREIGFLYPFGYGLSYTEFEYSNLKLSNDKPFQSENIQVAFTVKNIGKVKGDDVPQLYIHDSVSSVTTYVKKLRGFDRITLSPGESQKVTFTITPDDLSIWDMNMNFTEELGIYTALVGHSSEDIVLKKDFEVEEKE